MITIEKILDEIDSLLYKGETLEALSLLTKLGQKHLGPKIFESVNNLYEEAKMISDMPESSVNNLDMSEIKELTIRHVEDIRYILKDIDILPPSIFSDINQKIYLFYERLKFSFTRVSSSLDVNDSDFSEETNIETDDRIYSKFTFRPINSKHEKEKTDRSETEKIDVTSQPQKKSRNLLKTSILLVFSFSTIYIINNRHKLEEKSNSIAQSLFNRGLNSAYDELFKSNINHAFSDENLPKKPGLYLSCNVYKCQIITNEMIEIVPFDSKLHQFETGVYYDSSGLINNFRFCKNLKKGTRINYSLVGLCE